jgi:cobalamin biosynthesis protein CbiG
VFDDLEEAVRQLCRREGFSPLSLTAVAASARRRDFPALEAFAERRRLPMLYYADAVLQRAPGASPGKLARTSTPAAILAAGATEAVVPSRAYFGKLTLALARRKS